MNQVAPRAGNQLASIQNLKAGLSNVRQSIVTAGGDPFLRLLQDGSWVFGAENIEVEEDSLWAVNPYSLEHGFVCWTDYDQKKEKRSNKTLGERMVPMTESPPLEHELPEYEFPWVQQLSISVVCVQGAHEGTQVLYKATSEGGKRAVRELVGAIMAQLDADPGRPVPIVVLDSGHYTHKVWGKTYTPSIVVTDWETMDATELSGGAADEAGEPEEEPAPAARTRTRAAKADPEPAPEQEDEPPFEPDDNGEDDAAPEPAPATRRRRRR